MNPGLISKEHATYFYGNRPAADEGGIASLGRRIDEQLLAGGTVGRIGVIADCMIISAPPDFPADAAIHAAGPAAVPPFAKYQRIP